MNEEYTEAYLHLSNPVLVSVANRQFVSISMISAEPK